MILSSFCQNYDVIYISSVYFDDNSAELINDHCDSEYPCTSIISQMESCRSKGVKFFVTVDGVIDEFEGFSSVDDAKQKALSIQQMFGSGTGAPRPLGTQLIEGLDIVLNNVDAPTFVTEFAAELKRLQPSWCLSASPTANAIIGTSNIKTMNIVKNYKWDILNVRFFGNGVNLLSSSMSKKLIASWKTVANNSGSRMLLGLAGYSPVTNADSGIYDVNDFKKATADYPGIGFFVSFYPADDTRMNDLVQDMKYYWNPSLIRPVTTTSMDGDWTITYTLPTFGTTYGGTTDSFTTTNTALTFTTTTATA
jgi:hypothetical protein